MEKNYIDYGKLVDEAMHIIVYKVLKMIEGSALPGDHHFFISFLTQYPNVRISEALSNKYPREMTIVMQYQYQDLEVTEAGFAVTLGFNGVKERIYVPYSAMTTFADPSVQFGLQFREVEYDERADWSKSSNVKNTKKSKKEDNVIHFDQIRALKRKNDQIL